jgi:hypothetical protein
MFRSHRNRIFWRNGKLHIIKQTPQRTGVNSQRLTAAQEEHAFKRDIRQWLIFYSMLVAIIAGILIHRMYANRKISQQ